MFLVPILFRVVSKIVPVGTVMDPVRPTPGIWVDMLYVPHDS